MAKKTDRILTNRERKIFRKHIPISEVLFGGGFIIFVGVMGVWFGAQSDNYDPTERDVSMEAMEAGVVEDKLYRTPLMTWVDPTKAVATGGAPAVDTSIFPPAILDGGWSLQGRVQAFTVDNVYEKINGAVDQYAQYGLDQAFFFTLTDATDQTISVEAYYHKTFPNALGIFAAQRGEDRTVESADGVYFYSTSVGGIGIAGPYYFKITGAQEGEATQAKARQLMAVFASMAAERYGLPKAFGVLAEDMGFSFSEIEFQTSDVFQFDFAKDFWFAKSEGEAPRLFVHEAAADAEAKTLFDQLVQNNLFDYDAAEQSDGAVVLKHKFIDDYLVIRQRDNLVYGVDGTPDLGQAQAKIGTLEGAFFEEAQ